ncbi:MAG: reactive intermediate/imine deaminase [Planctomycetaceae bacterium]|nr:reactive intermediate/imine deaminase [Planctomycetaceae bacterium]
MSDRELIHTDQAPAAIGPYSQAVKAGGVLYCSGQIPLHPQTGELVGAGDVAQQTEQVLANLKAVIEAGGATLGDVVRCELFLTDMGKFQVVNEIYGKYFGESPPARFTAEVSRLPKDVEIEIAAIVHVP